MSNYLPSAILLALTISAPLIGGVLAGGIVAALVQSFVRFRESSLQFVFQLMGFALSLYLTSRWIEGQLFSFAARLWGERFL